MKKLRNLLILILVFSMCTSTLHVDSFFARASGEIGIKPGSNLSIVSSGGKQILTGLQEKKTFDELLTKLNTYGTVYAQKNGSRLDGSSIVSTGTMVVCGDTVLHVVIKGDTSGDGVVNTTDLLRVKGHFLKEVKLEEQFLLAADTSQDGIVNLTDYLQIRQYLLKGWNIYSTPDTPAGSYPSINIVQNGYSDYTIVFDSASERTAAYTLRETLKTQTGAQLPVALYNGFSEDDKVIYLQTGTEQNVGNCGYSITTDENRVTICASALSGFDNAMNKLVSDCASGRSLSVPGNYSIQGKRQWQTNYVPESGDYKSNYRAGLFYNDKNDSVAYVSNAMWHMFGAIDDGQDLVYRFGNEPTWFEWMSEKIAWSTDDQYIYELKEKLRCFPQTSTGYMWSWSTYPYWKVDDCYSIHYDGTFRYISAVYDIISWEGSTQFLSQVDTDTASGQYADIDASRQSTVLEKTEACMDYILDYLHGSNGYIRLTEESTYLNASGSKRFDYVKDANYYCWNNTGKDGSTASNYWDNLCFGNYDGYSNALFYNALHSMAGIYRMLGGSYIAKAEELEALAADVKERFNDLYWSEETGRYIACIDTNGRAVDYGFTFHNFEIMKYGLADSAKAKSILDWVDGDRIIAGEDRTGSDILSYSKMLELLPGGAPAQTEDLRLAAVTNTVAINNPENEMRGTAWWHGPDGINVWGSASYGRHLENGGYIFYPVFYELMARTEYEGAQSTTDRLFDIGRVYEYNRLVSDMAATHSTNWLEGLVGEFPESGLVPTAYLYSLVGASAEHDGLHLAPAFNEVYEYMGTKELSYGGKTYGVQVNRDASCVITPASGSISMNLHYTPERFRSAQYTVTLQKTNGTTSTSRVTPDANGVLHLQLNGTWISKVTIAPVLE